MSENYFNANANNFNNIQPRIPEVSKPPRQKNYAVAIVAVAEEWGKQVLAIDPKSIRLF